MNKIAFLEQVKIAAFDDEFQKLAEKSGLEPGWMDSMRVQMRATRTGDKGFNKILANNELIGARSKGGMKGALIGLPSGAAIGAGIGTGLAALSKGSVLKRHGALAGAGFGALIGGSAGADVGVAKADLKHMKDKGVTLKKGLKGLLGYVSLTPEAKAQYLDKYKKS